MNKRLLFLLSFFLFFGCATDLTVVKKLNFNPGDQVLRVVVLPFIPKTSKGKEVIDQVREEIAANLQEGNYDVVELTEIDQFLFEKELTRPDQIQMAVRKRQLNFHEEFDADLILQGRVLEWTKTYLALHSDVELDVELFLYDAKSGKLIAKIRKGVIKNSGISRVPTGYVSVGTAPLLGLRKSVQQDVIHNLTRQISQPLIQFNQKDKTL